MPPKTNNSSLLTSYIAFKTNENYEMANSVCQAAIILENEELTMFCIAILKSPIPPARSSDELLLLRKMTSQMSYFKELSLKKKHIRANTHQLICAKLKYCSFDRGASVCHLGDPADRFYVILKGGVNVLLPKEKKREGDTIDKLINLWSIHKNDIEKKQKYSNLSELLYHMHMRENEKNEFAEILNNPEWEARLGGVKLGELAEPERLFQDGNMKFQSVTTLKPGQMFGEIGLLLQKPRAATILCLYPSEFAFMERDDFKEVLADVEAKKLAFKVKFFKKYMFEGLSTENVMRISYMFGKERRRKGGEVRKEGEEPEEVVLVKKGEIMITKRMKISNQNGIRVVNLPLCHLSIGETFGEYEIIEKTANLFSAIVISSEATLYTLDKNKFLKIVPGKSEIFKNISTKMHMKYNWYKNRIKNFLESYKVFNQQQKPIVPPVELDFIRRAAGDLDDKIANTEKIYRRESSQLPGSITNHSLDIPSIVQSNQRIIHRLTGFLSDRSSVRTSSSSFKPSLLFPPPSLPRTKEEEHIDLKTKYKTFFEFTIKKKLFPRLPVEIELQSKIPPRRDQEERSREKRIRNREEMKEDEKREGKNNGTILNKNERRMIKEKGRKKMEIREIQELEGILEGSLELSKKQKEIDRSNIKRKEFMKEISLDLTGKKMNLFKIM